MIRLKKQISFGIFGILFGVIGWIITDTNVKTMFTVGTLGMSPKAFPRFVLALAAISGLILVISALIKKDDEIVEIDLRAEAPVMLFFLILIVYYLLFKKLGFIITSIGAGCLYLGLNRCRHKLYYGIIVILTIALYFIFTYIFRLQLPLGWPLSLIF